MKYTKIQERIITKVIKKPKSLIKNDLDKIYRKDITYYTSNMTTAMLGRAWPASANLPRLWHAAWRTEGSGSSRRSSRANAAGAPAATGPVTTCHFHAKRNVKVSEDAPDASA